jgi:hypothetical protein
MNAEAKISWLSPNTCCGHLTPGEDCLVGSDEFDISSIFCQLGNSEIVGSTIHRTHSAPAFQ